MAPPEPGPETDESENRLGWSLLAALVGACLGLLAAAAFDAPLWQGAVLCAGIGGLLGFVLGAKVTAFLQWFG